MSCTFSLSVSGARALAIAVALAVAAALVPPAVADDGVLEIDQTCVAAGCFPGDTAGFPVQITTPGSYVLTSNLTVPDGATGAIVIDAQDVALDLGGFRVAGPVECQTFPRPVSCMGGSGATGIQVDPAAEAGVVVRNGAVRGFGGTLDSCVRFFPTGVVEDLTVSDCAGVGVSLGSGGAARRVIVREVLTDGILFGGFGTLTDSAVEDVGGRGVVSNGVVTATGNVFRLIGGHGIEVAVGTLAANGFFQVGLETSSAAIECTDCSISNVTIRQIAGVGVRVVTGAVTDSTISFCSSFGIEASSSVGYGGNNLASNNGGGAQVGGAGALLETSANVCGGDATCP
jgi:hypothetical protein